MEFLEALKLRRSVYQIGKELPVAAEEIVRLVKDHIAVSLSIEPADLDLNPFDRKGGLGRSYEVFGENYAAVLAELNMELVA